VKKWLWVLGVLLVALIIWIVRGNRALEVNTWTVSGSKLPDAFSGFRIVQVSDLHNTEFGSDNQKLLSLLADTDPDIIVITGDLIDSRRTDVDIALRFAASAMEIAPVYYVTGNHESRLETEFSQLETGLKAAGVTVLRNESVILEQDGQQIQLLGMDDITFYSENAEHQFSENLKALKDDELYTVLLSHKPNLLPLYAEAGMDMVFSGYAHGGQFRMPWIGGILAPDQGFFPKYDSGLYTLEETSLMVSRGLGNSLFPFRVNNPPEIVVVQLTST
jgi:predicted MPP superfamily phosphohydrolase